MTTPNLSKLVAATMLGASLAAPALAPAQNLKRMLTPPKTRQGNKNLWRNLGIAGGAAGVAGLLTGNKTLGLLGLGGGAYSAWRYEQDRKSQNREEHNRYMLFRNRSFDYQGHRYVRRERWDRAHKNKSYYFERVRR